MWRAIAIAWLIAAVAAAALPPPNVIVLLSDDMGVGDVTYNAVPAQQHQPGAGGRTWAPNPARTPHLDAMAAADSTLVLHRHYAGSPVCSPTRASILSGRTPDRECVFDAEGCGQEPAASCIAPQPFPGSVPTLPRALAGAGYDTLHLGKWHLGDFFPKDNPSPSYAYRRWPVMTPGCAGFTSWASTEASAASTTFNCGCNASWPAEPPGCVLGGGVWSMGQALTCTELWTPSAAGAASPACVQPVNATRSCVEPTEIKVTGDSSQHLLDRFEAFLTSARGGARPFFATLQLHTNHVPHPALPEFFHSYNGTDGAPAGDYRGTISQMDAAVGRLRALLRSRGIANNTLLWFFADNGPHPGTAGDGAGGIADVHTSTNGLRQCKASVFEGGVRVPGMVEWPAAIHANAASEVPIYAPDVLPTVLEAAGVPLPWVAGWASDGESVLRLIQGDASFARRTPLVWRYGPQAAVLDAGGRYKYVRAPAAGQCARQGSSYANESGPFLFDLLSDPTESAPVTDAPGVAAALAATLSALDASIAYSQVKESGCLPPPLPPGGHVRLVYGGSRCLGAAAAVAHAALTLTASNCGDGAGAAPLTEWVLGGAAGDTPSLASVPSFRLHSDAAAGRPCAAGTSIVVGEGAAPASDVRLDSAAAELLLPECPSMCVGGGLAVAGCSASDGWTVRSVAAAEGAAGGAGADAAAAAARAPQGWARERGRYVRPGD